MPWLTPANDVSPFSYIIAVAALVAFPLDGWSQQSSLPAGFVRLSEVAPTIQQDIRYAGSFNFTGRRVPGYDAPQCLLWRPAAEALARAQARLAVDGFSLKVYDCYRPARAVRAFAAWSRARDGDTMKSIFYPNLDKSRLFALGYISLHSKHPLGIAVDLGLVRADETNLPAVKRAGPCDGPFEKRIRESSLDFGTTFDCFSESSATFYPVSVEARDNRRRLVAALRVEGFKNYSREWWHFEFSDPSAPSQALDDPIR